MKKITAAVVSHNRKWVISNNIIFSSSPLPPPPCFPTSNYSYIYQWEHKLTHFPLGQMTVNWGNFCLQTSSSLCMEKRSIRVKIGCSFLSSHGQHLVLLLNGMRNMIKVNEMSTAASYLLIYIILVLEVFWVFCPWLKPLFDYLFPKFKPFFQNLLSYFDIRINLPWVIQLQKIMYRKNGKEVLLFLLTTFLLVWWNLMHMLSMGQDMTDAMKHFIQLQRNLTDLTCKFCFLTWS